MPYFTHLKDGNELICAHHSYNQNKYGHQIINIFDFTVHKIDEDGNVGAENKNFSEQAVSIRLKAFLYRNSINNENTEYYES